MNINEAKVHISGTVAGIVYANDDNGYTVLRLNTGDGIVTVVGCIPSAAPGESLDVAGVWTSHPSYGQQLKADFFERREPEDRKAIYEYLAFGAVKGIGPATAAAIVTKFGEETLDVLENEPERLAEIKGISRRKALLIGNEYRKRTGLKRLMEFFTNNGIRPELAVRVYRRYGDDGLYIVQENPYILTREDFGADFFEADSLALAIGFDGDSRERTEAAVIFELAHNLGNGHTFLPENKLVAATAQLLSSDDAEKISRGLEALIEGGYIVRDTIAGCDACYLSRIYEDERYTAEKLMELASVPSGYAGDADKIIDRIEKEAGVEYDVMQRKAVELAAGNRVLVITGGPGTGKTTSVKGILSLFDRMGLDTSLAAPTGRAAKRMSELTGRPAMTIHRLLGAGFSSETDEAVFEYDGENQLKADAVILDEASMVDITLMRALLEALRPGCRLVLVGDSDQLPSVGPGNVFSDVIRSGAVPAVRFRKVFRQAKESRIIRNAHMINDGEPVDLGENKGDFFFLQRKNKQRAAETIAELCAKRLPENMGMPAESIQVLTPSRKGETGSVALNKLLQNVLNPESDDKKERAYGEYVFRQGDRVMQTRNNYDILWKSVDGSSAGSGIFNGDVGTVEDVDFSKETVLVNFDGKRAEYLFDMLYELEPAYAMTVHKSQGSEYRAVVLSVSREAPALLTRAVLYTAVTRAKELLVVVGDRDIFKAMAENDKRPEEVQRT